MSRKRNTGNIVYSTDSNFTAGEDNAETESKPAALQPLRIKLDKKHRGGKVVTLIEGFEMKDEEINELCKKLKALCGAGGSYKEGQLIVQGDHRDKVLQSLLNHGFSRAKKI